MSILLLTEEGLYASRDRYGRTPIVIGQKEDAFCASFEVLPISIWATPTSESWGRAKS